MGVGSKVKILFLAKGSGKDLGNDCGNKNATSIVVTFLVQELKKNSCGGENSRKKKKKQERILRAK